MHTHEHDHTHQHDPDDQMDLQVEGEVLAAYWDQALDLVRAAVGDRARRVVDLGAGIGTGSLGLAARFPAAQVTAVDASAQSLARAAGRVTDAGLGHRVDVLQADLDEPWPARLSDLDLTWASMSLHHLTDPVRVMRDIRTATRPGGLLVVAELRAGLRFLPDDVGIGDPGLEERLMGASEAAHREVMPTLGGDWTTLVAEAGWDDVVEHTITIDQPGSAHPRTGEFAHTWFTRLQRAAADRIDDADRDALAALLSTEGAHSLLHRADLRVRGVRTLTTGRRA